jgi:nitrate/nitrite transporter NarK
MKRLFMQFICTLLVVGFVLAYWWVIALIIGVVALICGVIVAWHTYESSAERLAKRDAAVAARADQQHRWVMEGDPRGTYGPAGAVLMRGIGR